MWDGKSVDELRYLRAAVLQDLNHLRNAPLSLVEQKRLVRSIAVQLDRLDVLNQKRRKR